TAPTIVSPGPDRTIANQEMEWLLFHATARGVAKGTHPTSTPEPADARILIEPVPRQSTQFTSRVVLSPATHRSPKLPVLPDRQLLKERAPRVPKEWHCRIVDHFSFKCLCPTELSPIVSRSLATRLNIGRPDHTLRVILARSLLCLSYMVYAINLSCRIEEFAWMSPTTFRLRFSTSKRFTFRAGQFISVVIPAQNGRGSAKRCYSIASAPDETNVGYELCVKVVPGGLGSTYLAGLKVGDTFQAAAPYGHFTMKSKPGRNIVFISTATGIAPFRSMVFDREFYQVVRPKHVVFVAGSRTEDEILYRDEIEEIGIEVVRAVSHPTAGFNGFRGRVTDYLRSLPATWTWHDTDFYICGNPEMVMEVEEILRTGRGVDPRSIYRELFSAPKVAGNVISIRRPATAQRTPSLVPAIWKKFVAKGE
ncbi:MAG: FAD-dependent oxidoreductase, partial [Deltaproteobacteria bacterium]|nr:FAD-dependent oxidoreductase [Deltaproteobacteria bacterium]